MATTKAKTVNDKLAEIQDSLKVPKGQRNSFGNYNYRKAEDVLQAIKPFLEGGTILLNDELVIVGERYYIKATATITYNGESIAVDAYARESLTKKGMDDSQVTGATSSYARKYALNGLFAIDNTDDADSMDNSNHQAEQKQAQKEQKKPKFSEMQIKLSKEIKAAGIDAQKWSVEHAVGAWNQLTNDACANYLMALENGDYNE